ncbi:MAG: hypothetical protein ACOC3D_09350 [Pseudomonadota bacterium]
MSTVDTHGGAKDPMEVSSNATMQEATASGKPDLPLRLSRALIVEPHPAVAASLARQCHTLGWVARIVERTEAVAAALAEFRPHAVVTSIVIPDPEAFAVLAAIATHDHDLPVLCLLDHRPGATGSLSALRADLLPRRMERAAKPLRHRSLAEFLQTAA